MAIKVPGEKPASETGTLLTNATLVHSKWHQPRPPAPTIDWQYWNSLFDMQLWQALALSCGIIPDYPNEGQDAEYDRRMVIALNHMQPGALLADIKRGDRPHLTRVKLADVARLAAALDWSLPDAFPRLQPPMSAPMANEHKYRNWMEIEEGSHVRFGDLPLLIAKAQHHDTNDELTSYLACSNLETELKQAVQSGALTVRNPLGLGRHTFPIGQALQDAVVLAQDLEPLLNDKGIGLRIVGADYQWQVASTSTTKAIETTEPRQDTETLADAPVSARRILRKGALIQELRGVWPTIENDIKETSRGGIYANLAAARVGHGLYDVEVASNWAKENGRITTTRAKGGSIFDSPTTHRHTLK